MQPSCRCSRAPSEVGQTRRGPYHGGAGADPPPFSNLFAPQGVSQPKLPLLVLHSGAGPAGPLLARLHIRTGFRHICDRNKCDCDS